MQQRVFRKYFLLIAWCCCTTLAAQQFFPVKIDKKWGLIDTNGQLVQPAVYDAIGEFKHFGHAVMQKNGQVGLLAPDGTEAILARFDDIKVLDVELVAVMEGTDWRVINLDGQTVINKGYDRVRVLRAGFLAYQVNRKWGIVNAAGQVLAQPVYDHLEAKTDDYFQLRVGNKIGLMSTTGQLVLAPKAAEVRLTERQLVFYRVGRRWGAVTTAGTAVLGLEYESFRELENGYYKLFADQDVFLYSVHCQRLLPQQRYSDYYVLSKDYLVVEKNERLGIIDACGLEILPPLYQEIQPYGSGHFRVNFDNSWGVVNRENEPLIPLAYQYISPMQGAVCMVKQNNRYGLLNAGGEVLVPPKYAKISLSAGQAQAYQTDAAGKEQLTIYRFDANGKLLGNDQFNQHFAIKIGGPGLLTEETTTEAEKVVYELAQFEWFFQPQTDRWGLRSTSTGDVQIEPTFDFIKVDKALGYTVVGINKANDYDFERTTFRYDVILGLVLNDLGILVTEVDFLDVRLEDFAQGSPLARVVFSNGRHGLIDELGRVVRQDITYIGPFCDGLARVSFAGKLSGSRSPQHPLMKLTDYQADFLSPNYLLDYTQYDQLFQLNASLTCEECEWGYIDTLGRVQVKPQYTFVYDMVNETGLVNCAAKWGMVSPTGRELIPCRYDQIEFLENTGNRMVRVYLEEPKYGLIDTLGQLTVSAIYEEIGSFSDGRLAVKRNDLWGFVDRNGREVIPCRFAAVNNFSEGKASAKLGRSWGFIDKNGDTVLPFAFEAAGDFQQGLAWVETTAGVGYLNEEQRYIIPPRFAQAYNFDRGVARVVEGNLHGLIRPDGSFVLKPKYTSIEGFDEHGLAIVRFAKEQTRFGLINLAGELLTHTEFRAIEPFREGLARAKDRHGVGFLDTKGRLAIPTKYTKAGDFYEGRAMVQSSSKCGYIDRSGELIVPCAYSRCQDFSGGRAVVYQGITNAGIVDRDGQLIIEPSLDRLLDFQEGRGLMRDANYRFYYITEETSLYDGYYDRATAFRHGVAVVQIDGKWGIINQKGIEIIPPKYDHIERFENGYAKVKIEGYNGLSNLAGELIVQPHYEFISYAGEGLFRVEQGDKIGYFDQTGEWVWELKE